MSAKKPGTPLELVRARLAQRPQGSRCALVVEPDQLVEWTRALVDAKGREWEPVLYRGDDWVTRRAFDRVWGGPRPVCLVLARPAGMASPLDASAIGDLVSRAEGDVVDLTIAGYFHTLFPKVNPPLGVLSEYRQEFIAQIAGIHAAYAQFKLRWHEPDSWTRGQFLAILLMARLPALDLDQLWCDEVEPARYAAHALWILCHPSVTSAELPLVAEVVRESSHRGPREQFPWLDVAVDDLDRFREDAAGYLALREALASSSIEHLDSVLAGCFDFHTLDPHHVGPQADVVIQSLKDESRWTDIQRRAEPFLTMTRLEKANKLLSHDGAVGARLIASADSAPPLAAFVVRQALMARFQDAAAWPLWTEGLGQHELVREHRRAQAPLGDSQRRLMALMCATSDLAGVENALATSLPSFSGPEQLLDWYVDHDLHLLEYHTAEAFARLESLDDAALHRAGYEFVMREPNGLRFRVRAFLNQLDGALAAFIGRDPQKFAHGPRSAVRIIPDVLRGGKRRKYARVWVLVMDGMRFDTWQAIVRPLLLEHFEVVDGQDRPFFSLLPSKTDIARRGLLAGALGKDWKNYFQKPTKEERILAARALGLTNQDLASRMAFVTDAETTEARERLGYDADEGRDANVLIYPISDYLGHYHNDTLASLNEKIRQQLLTQQGRRGIVDDLRRRIRPGDLVLLTSDHGFQELFAHEQVRVSRLDALNSGASEDDVTYRYLRFEPKKPLPSGSHLSFPWEELAYDGKKTRTVFTLAVGGTWYQREKGRPTRFSHGGVSLAEMTIPCVLLKPIEQKAARVEILDLPRELNVAEDETVVLAFDLANTGNVDARFELVVKTNLGEQLIPKKLGTLAAGRREHFTCLVRGRFETNRDRGPIADKTTTAVMLELAHDDLSGHMIRPGYGSDLVRVSVKPKPTKIDTDVLKDFDDL